MPYRGRIAATVLGLLLVAAGGCAGSSALEDEHAGRTVTYQPGVPNFDMEAFAAVRDGETGVDVFTGIPLASLVFVERGDAFVATVERLVRLVDRETGSVVAEASTIDTLRAADYETTQSYRPVLREDRVAAPPGEYAVEVAFTDRASDERVERRQAVEVVARASPEPFLSRLRLEGSREGDDPEPILSLHIPSDVDALRAIVEVHGPAAGEKVAATFRLLRFTTDTTIAAPPYWLSPSRGSLAYWGIDEARSDTLQLSRRPLVGVEGPATVEFALPPLEPGLYRLEVETGPYGPEEEMLRRSRELSVKSPAFPSVETLPELVEALEYIAYEGELRHIREAETARETKRRFDAFWGGLIPSRQAAANVVELYYSRVEEANLLFTDHKEGWKTDRGMVYVVLGPPVYVERSLDAEVWHYSYDMDDPSTSFVFDRVGPYERDELFERYVLQRRPYYQYLWDRYLERWRRGEVL